MKLTRKTNIGKDGKKRTKVIYDLIDRQAMFNRQGLTPPKSAWLVGVKDLGESALSCRFLVDKAARGCYTRTMMRNTKETAPRGAEVAEMSETNTWPIQDDGNGNELTADFGPDDFERWWLAGMDREDAIEDREELRGAMVYIAEAENRRMLQTLGELEDAIDRWADEWNAAAAGRR